MRIVVSWLRELCPAEQTVEELAHLLTANGANVERIDRPWERLSGVSVARVLEVRDHPHSAKLCLARITTGSAEREVVVGVRNMVAGDLVPYAGPGASVPGLPDPLSAREIRGVVSSGMLCSPRELGISADHGGILVLHEAFAPGDDFASVAKLDDAVLDIEVTPNRPDLMSVLGVARELAAATGVPLRPPEASLVEADPRASDRATVEVLDQERCPRYLAKVVHGVTVRTSPVSVQARLFASGMRPLSNVVDATNYVLLELGQPLHPFDLDRLADSAIVVRRAGEGETLVSLDGVERRLIVEDLVIADREKAVAIAGVVGSADAEVSAGTVDVLLESAHFRPAGVLRTSRRLDLRTEASVRFERGCDPEGVPGAADRAAALMAKWSGGTVLAGSIDVGTPPPRRRVNLRPSRASLIAGHEVSSADAVHALERLGMAVTPGEGLLQVEVPGYRVDLQQEIDIIEEVIRVRGYDLVGSTLPAIRHPGGTPEPYALRRRLQEALVRAGLRETWSLSFASPAELELMGHSDGIRVSNPLSAEEAFLRSSLLPGLLRAARRNLSRQIRSIALFEVGTVFLPGDPVEERQRVAFVLAGSSSESMLERPPQMDFFDAKGVLETVVEALGVREWTLSPPADMPFHPARSCTISLAGEAAGSLGELHPRQADRVDLRGRVAVAEFDVQALARARSPDISYRDVPRFPPVSRDLAFQVDDRVPAGAVRAALIEAAGGLVGSVEVFDVFTGEPLPPGKKSLAFSVEFRAPDRTLTDVEADEVVAPIVERLGRDFGAELRSG